MWLGPGLVPEPKSKQDWDQSSEPEMTRTGTGTNHRDQKLLVLGPGLVPILVPVLVPRRSPCTGCITHTNKVPPIFFSTELPIFHILAQLTQSWFVNFPHPDHLKNISRNCSNWYKTWPKSPQMAMYVLEIVLLNGPEGLWLVEIRRIIQNGQIWFPMY